MPPTLPPVHAAPAAHTVPPPGVQRAARLYRCATFINAVAVPLMLLPVFWINRSAVVEAAGSDRKVIAVGLVAAFIIVVVIPLALGLLIASRLRRGRNWARFAAAVWILWAVIPWWGGGDRQVVIPFGLQVAGSVIALVELVLEVWAVTLCFLPDANTWFRRRR